ncbi:MAG: DNA-3-methyladenine glycosylase family protein [Gemmatimonadales bacterium]
MTDAHVVTAELPVRGEFSLAAAARFGFGPTKGAGDEFDQTMRLAFPLDDGSGYAGAVIRQPDPDGALAVELELRGDASPGVALTQLARVISVDHDGEAFLRVGDADPVIGALQRAHPGQRPVLFHSPYEAAAWAIISARRPPAQGARVREELSIQLGETFELAGETVHAFPVPQHLLGLGDQFPGLNLEKLIRLRGVAEAALSGSLSVVALHALGPEKAYQEVQSLRGIGPFYAGLVVLRASGFADAMLPMAEPRLLSHAARLYGLSGEPTVEWLTGLAERWRPFRTWAMVLIRVAGDRGTTIP